MRDRLEHMKYEAGYPGEDSMRMKAEKLMREELMKTPMHLPASHSTPSHEKMRLYKKGGPVTKKAHHHKDGKEHERANLRKRQYHVLEMAEKDLEKKRKLSHGGHAHTNLYLPRQEKLSIQSVKEAERMRKGGPAHHKDHHEHYEHEHHHKRHHSAHKAAGGTIYEHHMLGQHPSRKRPHISYENEMMGEHCMHHALGHRHAHGFPSGPSNEHAFDASMGQYKKHGGRVKEHHKKRMAAGGAAKIRHGVATPSGMPIMKKSRKGY